MTLSVLVVHSINNYNIINMKLVNYFYILQLQLHIYKWKNLYLTCIIWYIMIKLLNY